MASWIPTPSSPDPKDDPCCIHRQGCSCRRPFLGWALVAGVAMEVTLALVAIAAGAPMVGLVACISIGGCMALAVVAEIVAFYRVGLGQAEAPDIGRNRGQAHRPGQAIW